MNTPKIQFEEITTPDRLAELRAYAATFEPPHVITAADEKHRIVAVKKDGVWFGYSIIVNTPIVFSAWSSLDSKPQDIMEAMKAFVGWARLTTGQGLTAVPLDTRTFPEKIMNKLGFYRLKTELYGVSNE